MSITQIQERVRHLPEPERRELTAWMVSEFPALRVEDLIARAAASVKQGSFQPTPPTEENVPKGKVLQHALRVATQLRLK